jgi:hypothetical protein
MTEDPRVKTRSELLSVEQDAGSDDPQKQAEIILEDSDARTDNPEKARHESAQTPD